MKIIEQCQISPPLGSVPECSLPLTFFDVFWLDKDPVKRCLFFNFPQSTSEFTSSHLPSLKSSLSLTLKSFFPLAGKIRLSPYSDDQFEIQYRTNDSITLTICETELNFFEFVGSQEHDSAKLDLLVPELIGSESGKPLLAIQLTIFPDKGIVTAFTISHVACDGSSYTHFIKSWAAACKSGFSASPLPSFDCAGVVADFHNYYLLAMKMSQPKKPERSEIFLELKGVTDSITAIFSLSIKQINSLKEFVKARTQNSSLHCSTFVVSSAYLWACMVKLQKYAADQMVYFPIAANFRQRLEPPVPSTYFGNCVFFSFVEMRAGDILKDDGIVVASEAIGKAIQEVDDGILKVIERSREMGRKALAGGSLFTIAGSPKFKVYGVDFGWGTPVRVEMCVKNRGMFLGDGREEESSIEAGVVLATQEMEEFSAIFSQGLKSF